MKFLALAFAALAVATPVPENGPDPRKVFIESITHGGNGCPQGSVGKSISNDRTTFTLIFDKYVASTGPGVPMPESRKACQLNINLRVPNGWAYSLATLTYRGYVSLPAGMTARQQSIYYFSGNAQQATFKTPFHGPLNKDYVLSDTIGVPSMVWSSCGAKVPVNVKSEVQINPSGNKQALMTTDSIDGKVKHTFGLRWRNC